MICRNGELFLSTSFGISYAWKGTKVSSLLEKLLAELVGEILQEEGRNKHTSMIIIDSPRF